MSRSGAAFQIFIFLPCVLGLTVLAAAPKKGQKGAKPATPPAATASATDGKVDPKSFIIGPEGQDVFVHFSSIEGDGFRSLKDGESVDYDIARGDKGYSATRVKRMAGGAPTPATITSVSKARGMRADR